MLLAGATGLTAASAAPGGASARPAVVELGAAGYFSVLAASTVTNAGPTVLNGNLGVSPGTSTTGFPPGKVVGKIKLGPQAAKAAANLGTAYGDAAGRTAGTNLSGQDLGGQTLTTGVYKFNTSAQLTGNLTFDGRGNQNAVFIVQIGSTLKTSVASEVKLVGGARACNVFWQVGSSATLGTSSSFAGNVLAKASVTTNSGVSVRGRLLAVTAAVTLASDQVTRPGC